MTAESLPLPLRVTSSASSDRRRFRLRVAFDRARHARPGRMVMPLVEQRLIHRGEQLQNERLLAAIAHRAQPPDLPPGRSNAAGDFDIEFVQKLIAEFYIVDAR